MFETGSVELVDLDTWLGKTPDDDDELTPNFFSSLVAREVLCRVSLVLVDELGAGLLLI